MISSISGQSALQADLFGNAPASPQSARGESVTQAGYRSEMLAASQANSPLYDQRANLTDQQVTARTQAAETAFRSGMGSQEQPQPQQPIQTPQQHAELQPRQVEPTQRTAAEQKRDGGTRQRAQRALTAYGVAAGLAAGRTTDPGELLSRSA